MRPGEVIEHRIGQRCAGVCFLDRMFSTPCPMCGAACRPNALRCSRCGRSLLFTRSSLRELSPDEAGERYRGIKAPRGAEPEMTIKGTAYLARRQLLEGTIGSAKLDALLAEVARSHPVFSGPILASTRIPMSQWIALSDAIIDRFYGGDAEAGYWRIGQESADFALAGPYRNLVRDRDLGAFAQAVATAWKTYYSHGYAEGTWEGDVFRYRIEDVPVQHICLEFTACAWVERGLQTLNTSVVERRTIASYARGDTRVEYIFRCDQRSPKR